MTRGRFLLRSEAHAQTGQVSVTEGEQHHEEDEPGVMVEEDGQVEAGLDVTHHEERDKQDASGDGHREQQTVLPWLETWRHGPCDNTHHKQLRMSGGRT